MENICNFNTEGQMYAEPFSNSINMLFKVIEYIESD